MRRRVRTFQRRFAGFWWSDRGHSALLLLLLAGAMFSPLFSDGPGELLTSVFFSLLLVSGVAQVSTRWSVRTGAGLVALAGIVLEWLKHGRHGDVRLLTVSAAVMLLYFVLLTLVLMWHVFQDGPVTSQRIQGAVAAYILVGITWSVIFRIIDLQFPGAFSLSQPAMDRSPHAREAEMIYFSFATLTTVGYGDITPLHPAARIFVILEGLIGQLFPATLLARLVSLATSEKKRV